MEVSDTAQLDVLMSGVDADFSTSDEMLVVNQ
jgi:hypothetical protein